MKLIPLPAQDTIELKAAHASWLACSARVNALVSQLQAEKVKLAEEQNLIWIREARVLDDMGLNNDRPIDEDYGFVIMGAAPAVAREIADARFTLLIRYRKSRDAAFCGGPNA